jgi:ribonuclease HI
MAEAIKKLRGGNVTLFWISGYSGIERNGKAHELAKRATGKKSHHPPQRDEIL